MRTNHVCELCGAVEFEHVSKTDRHGQLLQTVICRRCGLISHAWIPDDEQLGQYYGETYRREYQGDENPAAHRVVREWRRGRARFRKLQSFVNPHDRVLDVGSGVGCTLKQFELAGYVSCGIEPGRHFARFSRERLNCSVNQVQLQEIEVRAEFDFVLMIHVLEHLPHPADSLRIVHELLRPRGRVYVEVPNLAAPTAAPGRLFHRAHIHNFAPWTLIPLAQRQGFDVRAVILPDHDRNLGLVLVRSELARLEVDPRGYQKSCLALRRYSSFSYYLRFHYLWEQLTKQVVQLGDRLTATSQLAQIERVCRM